MFIIEKVCIRAVTSITRTRTIPKSYPKFLFKKAVLKVIVDFYIPVDWNGRREDSCGRTGQGRPHRRIAPRRLPGPPAESEAPGVGINSQV
jgi:hypothetical protein